MNTNIKVLISSIVVGIVYVIYIFLQPLPDDPGFGSIAQGLGFFMGVIVIAIIFGILGFLLTKLDTSWGKRFIRALSWFGISFAVILVLTLAEGLLLEPSKKAEWERSHPALQNHSPCEPYYTGNYTCEEWQKIYQPPQRKMPLPPQ